MWVLAVSNFAKGDEKSRPAMWIDGGIHANEIQSVEVVLYTAWFLCEMADESDTVRRLLDERVFFLMPMMSPDSTTLTSTSRTPRIPLAAASGLSMTTATDWWMRMAPTT